MALPRRYQSGRMLVALNPAHAASTACDIYCLGHVPIKIANGDSDLIKSVIETDPYATAPVDTDNGANWTGLETLVSPHRKRNKRGRRIQKSLKSQLHLKAALGYPLDRARGSAALSGA